MKYTITGYPTLGGDTTKYKIVENVEWNIQQSYCPNTDQGKGAEVHQSPPGDEVAIMLNASAVVVIGSMQFIAMIVEHVDTPSSNIRREEKLGRYFGMRLYVGKNDED